MRVISGKARGTKLNSLEGMETRPTLDRVKESLFNIIQNDIENSVFLDLFSGSGAIGIEAASRNAKKVVLCDKSKDAIKVIESNVKKTHLEDKIEIYNLDFKDLLNKINEKFDIIYIDPPYKTEFAFQAIKLIIDNKLVNDNSKIIVETDIPTEIEKSIKNLNIEIIDKRKYGRASILFLKYVNRKG